MNLSEFEKKVAKTQKPIVLDFWATWCVPCRVTKPVLEKLAREYAGEIEFLSIDADTSRELLRQFQVSGIPTVLVLRGGKVISRVTGAQSESAYRSMFESLAQGREIKLPMSTFDRLLRLGAGTLLMVVGISTGSWVAMGLGGLIAFFGIYDRCPVWRALTNGIQRK